MPTADTGEPPAEEGEDAVEATKAAKEEYNRTVQEQEISLQQRQTDRMQVQLLAVEHAAEPSMRWQSLSLVSAADCACCLKAAWQQKQSDRSQVQRMHTMSQVDHTFDGPEC